MRGLRALLLASAVAALTITTFAGPVSAAPSGKVAIVQGIPGTRVDICINGREIRSAMPYGRKVLRTLSASQKMLKFFKKDPRKCRGTLLAKKRLDLLPGADLTIVLTMKRPKRVTVFDNATLGISVLDPDMAGAIRHAADVGPVKFHVDQSAVDPQPWFHLAAIDPYVWEKGDQYTWTSAWQDYRYVFTMFVTRPYSEIAFVGPHMTYTHQGIRYEWILVGTTRRNARIVTIKRPVFFGP